ncbi:S-adenosyl-L-methionine-dependent methyltransferase [Gigaspora margarita]|uniref:S-adenosyl-L-methionine-dependent methyltransferase n=1 Tax=Gigaspora margarita TaxID=4874 RepID=A0A8H4AHL8_GIGMA|nr:S-adenosyl-L-methionine-dependent methyltransferase [Gigaspora margarita]
MGCLPSKLSEESNSINLQNIQTEFRFIDGRRFHNVENSVYALPNDDDEYDRLHMQHFLFKYMWQSNFSAPIEHILNDPNTKILDVGCGSVSWSFDMATKYIFKPSSINKTKNFTFVKANVLEGIPFDNDTFDYVFQRHLLGGYPRAKWPYAINKLVRVLKPGGFLEIIEPSMLHNVGPATNRLYETGMYLRIVYVCPILYYNNVPFDEIIYHKDEESMKQRGIDPHIAQKLVEYAQDQGQLENIKKEAINTIIGMFIGLKSFLIEVLQISSEEYDELVKASEKELFEYDTYFYQVRVYANKVVESNSESTD